MAPKSTPFKLSEPASVRFFNIFQDEGQLETTRRFAAPLSNADYDPKDENFDTSQVHRSKAVSKFDNKPTTKIESAPSVKRIPLADVTQATVGRPRSLSAALAEIARLEDELEVSKGKNKELKGEIVAYQDALHQADEDAGYF
ncbi:hypothetical protein BU25DRAFT_416864 [Macroventuria anomochaeta]|uniref:Uncharacterized protein n=1 Tax=Macroventuria anomochaeta TaxID=301207 RepID=A0ACB6SHB5_9PLEO|nr:uncharacterized protein BU25DRAFT_416864 [Macroventuria anomochaeta]KAF2633690.1 hypothetical protein BU25DRAFT_416864 [Macroventuria anomochaeta]